MATQGFGLLPSATLQPYGEQILKYGIGQLGTPIDVSKLTAKVAGPTAFQQAAQQELQTCMEWETSKEMLQEWLQALLVKQE